MNKILDEEPIIHSHITDGLPDDHPLAFKNVGCEVCHQPLHSMNNECMQTWLETVVGNFCTKCFKIKEVLQ